MYCDEVIKNVYLGQPKYSEQDDFFFDYYCDMTIHITPRYRIIFECDTCYILLQADGTFKVKKNGDIDSLKRSNEWIDSYYHDGNTNDSLWIDYEYTLFTGEKIVDVEPNENGYCVIFTDFTLTVRTYTSKEKIFSFEPAAYSNVLGSERLIRRCSCGGTGVLIIDQVDEYSIRCNKCKIGTYANPFAIDTIEQWNNASNLIEIGDYPAEAFEKCCYGKIEYIAIEKDYILQDDNVLDCDSVIIKVDGKLFIVGSCYVGQEKYDFSVESIENYNLELWPRKVLSSETEPIRFVRKEAEPGLSILLRFEIGNRPLLITSDYGSLIVGLSHFDCDDNWIEYENNHLLNDETKCNEKY